MPPAAVGAAFVAMGASAAAGTAITALAVTVYTGAAIGAVVGGVTALVTGGDILDGALKGALIGGVSSGVMSGLGMAAQGSTLGEAGMANTAATGGQVGGADIAGLKAAEAGISAAPTTAAVPTVAENVTPPVQSGTAGGEGTGFLSGAGKWINKNPMAASLMAQTLGGAASGMAESRSAEKQLDAAMERDRLLIDSRKVSGLTSMDLKVALPTISSFAEKPKWTLPTGGLLQAQGGSNA